MENFIYNEEFFKDIDSFIDSLPINELTDLPDGWVAVIDMCNLEPIFNIDAESLCQILADANEDRLSEDWDEEADVLKALKECIDFEKLKNALPKLYYPSGICKKVTKSYLINHKKPNT
jgi:hypothetical protein